MARVISSLGEKAVALVPLNSSRLEAKSMASAAQCPLVSVNVLALSTTFTVQGPSTRPATSPSAVTDFRMMVSVPSSATSTSTLPASAAGTVTVRPPGTVSTLLPVHRHIQPDGVRLAAARRRSQ